MVGTYNIKKVKTQVERLNLEKDLNPKFDEVLYNDVMNTYSGNVLSDIMNKLN